MDTERIILPPTPRLIAAEILSQLGGRDWLARRIRDDRRHREQYGFGAAPPGVFLAPDDWHRVIDWLEAMGDEASIGSTDRSQEEAPTDQAR